MQITYWQFPDTLKHISNFNIFICILGLYSRGKSHVLRLSVPIEHLLTFWNSLENSVDTTSLEEPMLDTSVTPSQAEPMNEIEEQESQESVCDSHEDNANTSDNADNIASISAQAIDIASSIVGTCLAQLCE